MFVLKTRIYMDKQNYDMNNHGITNQVPRELNLALIQA